MSEKVDDALMILISDIDGTLKPGGEASDTVFRVEKALDRKERFAIVPTIMPERLQRRIHHLQQKEKLIFGLCSGWPLRDLVAYMPHANFHIAESGAIIHFGGGCGESVQVFANNEEVTAAVERIRRLKERFRSQDDSGCYVLERDYSCLLVFVNRKPDVGAEAGLLLQRFGGMRRVEIDGALTTAELNFVEYRIPMITKDHGVREILRRLKAQRFYYYGNDSNDMPVFKMPGCIGFAPDSASEDVLATNVHRSGSVLAGTDTVLDCIEFGMDKIQKYVSDNRGKALFSGKEESLIKAAIELNSQFSPDGSEAISETDVEPQGAGELARSLLPWMADMTPPEYWHALDVAEKSLAILSMLSERPQREGISNVASCAQMLVAAALLHDIEEFAREPHEQAGARKAKYILSDIGRSDIAEDVADLILRHTDKKREWTDATMIPANILIDADVLSKFSFVGRFRSLLFQEPESRARYTADSLSNIGAIMQEVQDSLFFEESRLLLREQEIALAYYLADKIVNGDPACEHRNEVN